MTFLVLQTVSAFDMTKTILIGKVWQDSTCSSIKSSEGTNFENQVGWENYISEWTRIYRSVRTKTKDFHI